MSLPSQEARVTSIAFIAEFLLSAPLIGVVLFATNHRALARFEAHFWSQRLLFSVLRFALPFSGFSVNPARSLLVRNVGLGLVGNLDLFRWLPVSACSRPQLLIYSHLWSESSLLRKVYLPRSADSTCLASMPILLTSSCMSGSDFTLPSQALSSGE